MSETVWVALLTGTFTLVSGVVGVILTHRYSRTQAEAARREDRRRDARALLAQFVEAGTQWADAMSAMVPLIYNGANNRTFWSEWPDTDSGKATRLYAQTITRAAGELRLIVGDEDLLNRITATQTAMSDNTAMLALLDEGKQANGGKPIGNAMSDAWANYRHIRDGFRGVETRAAELLRGEL
jgi:hypothetical protein